MITITRMEPIDKGLVFEYRCSSEYELLMTVKPLTTSMPLIQKKLDKSETGVTVSNLTNNLDYFISLTLVDNSGRIKEPSCTRLFTPYPNKRKFKTVNYIHKDDYFYYPSGRSTCSPSILKLDENTYICSHDVFWQYTAQNLTLIFKSKDKGETWEYLSQLSPCFWGSLFLINGIVYMYGISTEYGNIMLHKSYDKGATWPQSVCLFEKCKDDTKGFHKAPMPTVISGGRLWLNVEYGTWKHKFAIHALSCCLDDDIMNPANWTITEPLYITKNDEGIIAKEDPVCIEGNLVQGFDGKLYNILRCNLIQTKAAVLCEVNKQDISAPLRFIKAVDLPVSHSKFVVRTHSDGYHYAMGNRIDENCKNIRQILSVYRSKNLIDWEFCKDIADVLGTADRKKAALQYPDWFIEEKDIVYVSRTAINKPYNFHNANNITFHRYKNFFA
ncbi:MAG TPA: exo-alpha-sialidase [Clostridia bacterium]|nr:exo-alpha-sialidase [Clostridia bacterium]